MEKAEAFFEKYKHFIVIILMFGFFGVFLGFYYKRCFHMGIGEYIPASQYMLFMYAMVLLAVILISYILLVMIKIDIKRMFVPIMLIFEVLFMVMFTPGTVPDEQSHFYTAYRYSNYMLFNFKQASSEDLYIRQADYNMMASSNATLSKGNYNQVSTEFTVWCPDKTIIQGDLPNIKNAKIAYIPSALGIAIARLFGLGSYPLFYLGRIFTMFTTTALFYLAMKKAPALKNIIFVLAMLPMTLHMVCSYSYDGFIIGMAVLFAACFFDMMWGEKPVFVKDVILISVISFLLCPSKLVYTPIVFFVLMIPKERFLNAKTAVRFKSIIIVAGMLGLLVMQFPSILKVIGLGNSSSAMSYDAAHIIKWANEPGYSLGWILSNLKSSAKVFLVTIFASQPSFYLKTFIGENLGWFQISTPNYLTIAFAVVVFLSLILHGENEKSFNFPKKLFGSVLILASVGLIMLSMWISWTPLSYNYIAGVQGRYFLPLFPLLGLVLRNNKITVKGNIEQYIPFFMIWISVMNTVTVFSAILEA